MNKIKPLLCVFLLLLCGFYNNVSYGEEDNFQELADKLIKTIIDSPEKNKIILGAIIETMEKEKTKDNYSNVKMYYTVLAMIQVSLSANQMMFNRTKNYIYKIYVDAFSKAKADFCDTVVDSKNKSIRTYNDNAIRRGITSFNNSKYIRSSKQDKQDADKSKFKITVIPPGTEFKASKDGKSWVPKDSK